MLVKLSDRLQMSVDLVDKCNTVADVGCDHAHTCIWLVQNAKADRCIGMDLRTGPLEKAKDNLQLYECTDKIELRLCYGLDGLEPDEADTVIIAGMGGEMIRDILDRDAECNRVLEADRPPVLILQPHSHVWDVRQSIFNHGYVIVDESMCREDDKFYPAIKAVRADCLDGGKDNLKAPDGPELYFGPVLLARRDKVLSQFLEIEYRKKKYLLDRIALSNTPEASLKRREVEGIYGIIREARSRIGNERPTGEAGT